MIYVVKVGYCAPVAVAIRNTLSLGAFQSGLRRRAIEAALLLCLITAAAAQTASIFPLPGANPAAMALDQQGNIYLVGMTSYSNFPVSANALQATLKAPTNAFIAKLSPAGQLLWATYFGGSAFDSATGVAVDPSGNVLVTGSTSSPDLPVLNAFQSTLAGDTDAFVLKLDPNGKMLYSTYCGGSSGDGANAIAVDSSGAAYITGVTNSNDFPGQGPLVGFVAAYVVKLAANGTFVYSYESTETDAIPAAIAVDASGSAYVAGGDSGSLVTAYPAFVYKLSPDGSQAIYQSHFGGSQFNDATAIALDSTGAVYVAGVTTSLDFPVVNPIQSTLGARPLWTSSDGGNTWAPIDNLPFSVLQTLIATPTTPQTLYAGASDAGVFQSTDGGNTWTAIDNGIPNLAIFQLALNPSNPSVLYAGQNMAFNTGPGEVYRTVDGGANWSPVYSSGSPLNQITVDPVQPSTVYALSSLLDKSTDGGNTWVSEPSSGVYSILVDPHAEGTVYGYASQALSLFSGTALFARSTNGAASWQALSNVNPTAPGPVADATTKPATIYAGVGARSNDGGNTWTALAPPPGFTNASAMAVDPQTGAVYAAGTTYGSPEVYLDVSGNHGQSWTPLTVPSGMPAITGIVPTPNALYAWNNYIQGSAFVVKLSPDGSTILYSTYLRGHGGTANLSPPFANQASGIALDAAGDMVVVGESMTPDFPTVNAVQPANAGLEDAFVAVISPNGQRIRYSSYLGGTSNDQAVGVAVDAQGNLIVAGQTQSSDVLGTPIPSLPTTGPLSAAFVAKLAVPAPAITKVVSAASYQPGIESGSWVMIQGVALADTTRTWQSSDFVGSNLPTALDGVSVTIDGIPAFVEYIGPTQINVLAPPDSATGNVNVVVNNNGHSSTPATAQLQSVAPAFFMSPSYNVYASVIPGYTPVTSTAPAMPGDLVVLWGTGFGPTNPPTPAGTIVTGAPATATLPVVTVGGVQVPVVSSVLTTGTVGLYQITIQLPANVPTGTPTLQASIGGAQTQTDVTLFVGAQ